MRLQKKELLYSLVVKMNLHCVMTTTHCTHSSTTRKHSATASEQGNQESSGATWRVTVNNSLRLRLPSVIMAALWNRAGHYIFALWFLSSIFYLSFFIPRLISAAADWMSTILLHMVWR